MVPGGLRLGTPALTTRSFKEDDIRLVAQLIDEGVDIALRARAKSGKTIKKFKEFIASDADTQAEINALGVKVVEFAKGFPFPGPDSIW